MENFLIVFNFLRRCFDCVVDCIFGYFCNPKREFIPSTNDPIVLQSATSLAASIRNRSLTSTQVVEAFIKRIKEVNGIINAVVDDRFDDALEEAKNIDLDIKNGLITKMDFEKKPFLGVPFTSKETTLCKGMRATFGLIQRKDVKATEDAAIVENLKKAGCILLGVTNTPQINLWYETHNPIYGLTKNPYNTSRNAGGSSGGEAAIVSACGIPIGLGTDLGGSIRIPSFMCGTFGHKSTAQLTPTKGMTYRNGSEEDSTICVAGPISKHAEDLLPLLKAILGPSSKVLDLDKPVDVTKLRYFYVTDLTDILTTPMGTTMRNAILKTANHFKEIASAKELPLKGGLEGFNKSCKLTKYWLSVEKGANFKHDVTGRTTNASFVVELVKKIFGYSDLTLASVYMLLNNALPTADAKWAIEVTNEIKTELLNILSTDGILLFPSFPYTAPYHHTSYLRPYNLAYFSMFNVLRLPVTQVPLGLDDQGLPLGIQVVAGPNQDRLCIAVAKELEKTFGGYTTPFTVSKA